MYRKSGFKEKLKIQNFVNSAGNCVHYICTKCLDFREIEYPELCKFNVKLCMLNVRNVCICRYIEYLELCKFNGKLCTLFVRIVYAKKLKILNSVNQTGNCVRYMYGMSGLQKNLKYRIA